MYSTVGGPYRVSWQPLLYRRINRQWKLDHAGPIIDGIASLGMALSSFGGFPARVGNYYRVEVIFRWYRDGGVFRSRICRLQATARGNSTTQRGWHIGTKDVGMCEGRLWPPAAHESPMRVSTNVSLGTLVV